MDADETKSGGSGPAEVYARRLRELQDEQAVERRQEKLLGVAKLAVAALTLISAIILLHYLTALEFLLAPAGVFVALAVWHEKRHDHG